MSKDRKAEYKAYYEANKEKRQAYSRKYGEAHKPERKAYMKVWYAANKKKKNNYDKKYRKKHKVEIAAKTRKWDQSHKEEKNTNKKKRLKTDIQYKLSQNLRGRLSHAVKRNFKSVSAVRDLGCSIECLKKYLEKKFKKSMTWDNYGKWEIDHIKPLSKFDLTDRKQLLKACHYTNLQPLWKIDNLKKGNK